MYRRVLAFDFDGTLAQDGAIPLALQAALGQLHTDGYALFVVTGRRFGEADLGLLEGMLSGIVWECGAVLHHIPANEVYLPFGQVDRRLVQAIGDAGIPLQAGRAIVTTRRCHGQAVWQVLNEWGGDAAIVHNRDQVRVIPPGAAKGAGLERLLSLCGFSPRNLVSFGDGEGDLSLLQLGEAGVAVADAVPPLREVAGLVTGEPGPSGVLRVLETYWLSGDARLVPAQRARQIPLGRDEVGTPVSLPAAVLASSVLGVFGDSGSGKSWVAGLLAEGMHSTGYQVLLIDPEGDFKGMRALPGFVALDVNSKSVPPPAMTATLLEAVNMSVVLDLSAYPVIRRDAYVADLLRALHPLRERKFRPHWIVLEEAQHFLSPNGSAVATALQPLLKTGGWALVSYRPDRLAKEPLAALDLCILTRLSEPAAEQALHRLTTCAVDVSPAQIPRGYAWLCGQCIVRLRPNARRVPHIRHLYKYLDTPLPRYKHFHFRDDTGFLGVEAASLFEFLQCLRSLPPASLTYHQARGDFARWARTGLGDGILGNHLSKLAQRSLSGEVLREALVQRVAAHYEELHASR